MQRQQRLGRLSLTRRLTLFFTVVAAIVVLGLGLLFLAETQRHFVVLDQMALEPLTLLPFEALRSVYASQPYVSRPHQ